MKKSKHIIRSTVKIVSKIVYLIIRAAFAFVGLYIAGGCLSLVARVTIRNIKLYGLKDGIAYAAPTLIALAISVAQAFAFAILVTIIVTVLHYAARTAYKFIRSISA